MLGPDARDTARHRFVFARHGVVHEVEGERRRSCGGCHRGRRRAGPRTVDPQGVRELRRLAELHPPLLWLQLAAKLLQLAVHAGRVAQAQARLRGEGVERHRPRLIFAEGGENRFLSMNLLLYV